VVTKGLRKTLLSASTSVGAGDQFNQSTETPTFQVVGISTTSTITVDIQISNSGDAWTSSGTTFSANGIGSYTKFYGAVRANITAYSSTSADAVSVYGIV